jgi:hypothetical protein
MRTLSAHEFIALPPLSAAETVSLILKLRAQVEPGGAPVPGAATDSYADMLTAGNALAAATPSAGSDGKGTAVREAHHAVQIAWGALERWLSGFTMLDDKDDPRVPQAKKLYGELFGEGLAFINHKVEVEWPETEAKLVAVKKAHLTSTFADLGGKVFWTKVQAAHGVEGDAAHLTTPTPKSEIVSDQATKMRAAQSAIRQYVAHVVGTVKPGKAATQEAADNLLRPLIEWPVRAARAPADPVPAPPVDPNANEKKS